MVVVPGATAVTNPVLFTVATLVLPETQAPLAAGIPDPVSCDVAFAPQTESWPVTVGRSFTVMTVLALVFRQPLLSVTCTA